MFQNRERRELLRLRRGPIIVLAAGLAATALAYGWARDGEFHLDDGRVIETNRRIRSVRETVGAFRPVDYLGPARPVAEITFAIDYAAAGLKRSRFLVTSLALHLAVAALVFLLVRDILRRVRHPRAEWLSAIVAAAFALHPIHAESVGYACQRAEVLAALFGVLSFHLLLAADAGWPRPKRFTFSIAGAAALVLATGSKTVAIAYPFAFLLHRIVIARGGAGETEASVTSRARRAIAVAGPSLLVAVATIARNVAMLGPSASAGASAGHLGPWRYLLTQSKVHWLYLRLIAVPMGFSVDRGDYPVSDAVPGLTTIAAGLGLIALGVVAVLLGREGGRGNRFAGRTVAFGILFWLLLLAPTSSVIPIIDVAVDHRTYLACVGALLVIVVGVDAALVRLLDKRAAGVGFVAALAWLGALGLVLSQRARIWQSDLALWSEAVERSPGSFRAATNHAFALQRIGARDDAIREYARALSLTGEAGGVAVVARGLSTLYSDAGDFSSALRVTETGIAADPNDAVLRNNRAVALLNSGRSLEALTEAERGLSLDPEFPRLHDTMGATLGSLGEFGRALEHFRFCIRIDPDELNCRAHEVQALASLGLGDQACSAYRDLVARARPGKVPANARQEAVKLGCR